MQALADAEQKLYFTRLEMAEFLGFLVNLGNVDETVHRVDGVLEMDAKAIYDSMYGASGLLAMEEKWTGKPGRNEASKCDSTVVSRRSKPQWWTNQRNGDDSVGTLLQRLKCMESCP